MSVFNVFQFGGCRIGGIFALLVVTWPLLGNQREQPQVFLSLKAILFMFLEAANSEPIENTPINCREKTTLLQLLFVFYNLFYKENSSPF